MNMFVIMITIVLRSGCHAAVHHTDKLEINLFSLQCT